MFDLNKGIPIKSPQGEYERLMCVSCEDKVNQLYESYAKDLFYDGRKKLDLNPIRIEDPKFGTILEYSNVQYHQLKSYLILNLWRACISSRPFFEKSSLPAERLENMRLHLYENVEFEEDDFYISVHSFDYSTKLPPCIIQPQSNKHVSYFIIGRTFYMYYHDQSTVHEEALRLTPRKTGKFSIQLVPLEQVVKILNVLMGRDLFKL